MIDSIPEEDQPDFAGFTSRAPQARGRRFSHHRSSSDSSSSSHSPHALRGFSGGPFVPELLPGFVPGQPKSTSTNGSTNMNSNTPPHQPMPPNVPPPPIPTTQNINNNTMMNNNPFGPILSSYPGYNSPQPQHQQQFHQSQQPPQPPQYIPPVVPYQHQNGTQSLGPSPQLRGEDFVNIRPQQHQQQPLQQPPSVQSQSTRSASAGNLVRPNAPFVGNGSAATSSVPSSPAASFYGQSDSNSTLIGSNYSTINLSNVSGNSPVTPTHSNPGLGLSQGYGGNSAIGSYSSNSSANTVQQSMSTLDGATAATAAATALRRVSSIPIQSTQRPVSQNETPPDTSPKKTRSFGHSNNPFGIHLHGHSGLKNSKLGKKISGKRSPSSSPKSATTGAASSNNVSSSSAAMTSSASVKSDMSSVVSNVASNSDVGLSTTNTASTDSSTAAAAAAYAPSMPSKQSALFKAKLFAKQAKQQSSAKSLKPKLKRKGNIDLTIQTQLPSTRPSLAERSPLNRPSKELERIASIGSNVPITPTMASARGDYNNTLSGGAKDDSPSAKNKAHSILLRAKKDVHSAAAFMSSSSSNSKLINEQGGSLYSFQSSSPGALHKSFSSALELKSFNQTKEDKEQLADDAWALLCSRVLPLFSGEGIRVPIEDLNKLVVMHTNLRVQEHATAKSLLQEYKDLLKSGMYTLDSTMSRVPDDKLIAHLTTVWGHFFSDVLPYWEGVFLPLQQEFDGYGKSMKPEESEKFWGMLLMDRDQLNIRLMTLCAFRDYIILPHSERLTRIVSNFELSSQGANTPVRLLQCFSILASILSADAQQQKMDELVKVLKTGWFSRSRAGKDRRGMIIKA
ncbi:Target of rapamycin complex 2 subunit bit61 [Yarrowia sp. C11]|nr:Target of rapamycin complex 2 subunit bit61 [Yarrowia sp. E02]KAG5371340.1 Target of rapamycin complex 2 subunit bit61 [Yarrowia sp. C11]